MNKNGSMPTPRYIDVEAFKASYKMAIYAGLEALKDKPIERDKAIAVMYTVFEALDAFPTATLESPRPDWTPCAEGLPSKSKLPKWSLLYLNCTLSNGIVTPLEWEETTVRGKEAKRWRWIGGGICEYKVVAWQPLPAPYRADQKEDAE